MMPIEERFRDKAEQFFWYEVKKTHGRKTADSVLSLMKGIHVKIIPLSYEELQELNVQKQEDLK